MRRVLAGLVLCVAVLHLCLLGSVALLHAGNDFGKVWYGAKNWSLGGDMYGLTPATVIPVSKSEQRAFWNMNPPHVHLLLLPFLLLPFEAAFTLWFASNLLALFVLWRTIRVAIGLQLDPIVAAASVAVSSIAAATAVTGQPGPLFGLLVTMAWNAERQGHAARAGSLAGLAMAAKPFLGVLLLLWAIRREWRPLVSAVLTVLASFALGLAVFGSVAHQRWVWSLGQVDWQFAVMNASVWGLLSRGFWATPHFTAITEVPTWTGPIGWTACVIMLLTTAVRTRRSSVDASWASWLLVALLLSPLGWLYYGWMVVGPFLAAVLARPPYWLLLAVPGLVVPHWLLVGHERWWSVTGGSLYFWTVLVLWVTVVSCRSDGPTEAWRISRTPPE